MQAAQTMTDQTMADQIRPAEKCLSVTIVRTQAQQARECRKQMVPLIALIQMPIDQMLVRQPRVCQMLMAWCLKLRQTKLTLDQRRLPLAVSKVFRTPTGQIGQRLGCPRQTRVVQTTSELSLQSRTLKRKMLVAFDRTLMRRTQVLMTKQAHSVQIRQTQMALHSRWLEEY